jgi:DNA-binding response OmpR family regulator
MALEFVVLSNDRALWREVEVALGGRPSIRTMLTAWGHAAELRSAQGERIVVVDDEGCAGALAVVQAMRAREHDTQIIYLAARHTIELERAVRRAGVSYYADKAATGRNVMLAIEGILRARQTRGEGEQRQESGEQSGIVQPGLEARKEEGGCTS